MDSTTRQYQAYFAQFKIEALKETAVGQTTEYVADKLATAMAHTATQRIMCQTDLYYLASEMYGMKDARSRAAGVTGRKIWFPPIHRKLCRELQGQWDSLIHLSRNMLKTTVAKVWCVQQILVDPTNVRIGMWSKSAPKVRSELKSIRGMLVNPNLLTLFPERLVKSERRWEKRNADAITVKRKIDDSSPERLIPMDEAQIEVHGLETTVTGRHYTHHYYDDIIDGDNTSTANMIEKARETWAEIQGLKSVDTIEKIVGTPWHQLDLYSEIAKEELIPAAHCMKEPGVTVGGHIIYPFYTKEWLARQKERMGTYLYSCQYPLDTRPKEHQMFDLPVPYWTKDSFPKDPVFYVAVDPSTGRSIDKTGFAVAAVSRAAPTAIFFVRAESLMLKSDEIVKHLVDLITEYCPDRYGIEYGLQYHLEALINPAIQEAQKKFGFRRPIPVDIKTGGGRGALDKATKIDRTLGAMTRAMRAFFMPNMKKLFAQMGTFNPNVDKNEDDILDACSMVIQTVPQFHQSYWPNVTAKSLVQGFTYEYFKRKKQGRAIRDRLLAS